MMKYFYRYAIYTGIICAIYTLLNSVHSQVWAEKWLHLKISTENIEKILPLILTILLIEVTYRIGKAQTDIQHKQIELQKQQCQIERFRIYHELHRDLFKLSNLSKLVLPKIYDYFTSTWGEFDIQEIKSFLKEFEQLHVQLENEEADYILHFGANDMMNDAVTMVCYIEYLLANVLNRKLPETANQNKFIVEQRFANMELTEPEYISYIHKIVNDNVFKQELEIFVKRKNELFVDKNNILERVRTAYNAD